MTPLRSEVIVATTGEYIALRYVETLLSPNADSEDATVLRLKDDIELFVVTVSGNKYTVSMAQQIKIFNPQVDNIEMLNSIIDKWLRIMSK